VAKIQNMPAELDSPHQIFLDIIRAGLWDDRLEYDLEDLQRMYGLDPENTQVLYDLLNTEEQEADLSDLIMMCTEKVTGMSRDEVYHLLNAHNETMCGYYADSALGDGWTAEEWPTFLRVFFDYALALKNGM
jgi:hypothetical protein